LRLTGRRFHVAALIDGFSRKLLALKVFARTLTWAMMRALVGKAVRSYGAPRFLVTDHGCQFRYRFRQSIMKLGTALVKGPVRSFRFNGKAERFFRTFKW
jgi:transposase InsO family protein